MALTVVAFIMTCFILNFYSKGTDEKTARRVPAWVRKIFIEIVGRMVFVTDKGMQIEDVPDNVQKAKRPITEISTLSDYKIDMNEAMILDTFVPQRDLQCFENEWILLSRILNRLFCVIISLAFLAAWIMLLFPIFVGRHK